MLGICVRRVTRGLAAGLLSLVAVTAAADDFRIETKIYSGKEKEPIGQNLTLFRAGYVYDYMNDPERTVVFDQPRGRFLVLDAFRKLKAEVKTDEVSEFVEQLQSVAARSSNAVTKFAADPTFDVAFDGGELTLKSQYITYKLKTEPAPNTAAGEQYQEFSNWYARFNSLANPGALPPFPRLCVNEQLAKRQVVPKEVQLTVRSAVARTEHRVSWRLLQRDQERIAQTETELATFKLVDFADFQATAVTRK